MYAEAIHENTSSLPNCVWFIYGIVRVEPRTGTMQSKILCTTAKNGCIISNIKFLPRPMSLYTTPPVF